MIPAMSVVRTWLRYAVPFALLSVVAHAPILLAALAIGRAHDYIGARSQLWYGWELIAATWAFQLVLVAGVAPVLGEPRGQLGALRAGLRRMARAAVPCFIAVLAIGLGLAALVVPGLLLFGMLAMTGASDQLGQALPAPLADSVAAARRDTRAIAIAAASLVVLDIAAGGIAHLVLVQPLPKQAAIVALARPQLFVRVALAAIVLLAPLPATAIAASYRRA